LRFAGRVSGAEEILRRDLNRFVKVFAFLRRSHFG
jgi:hypothetical protein